MSDQPVVIIGAGLAGLACAKVLVKQGLEVLILDRGDDIGGRVQTDVVDGFQLDRGFQVLQTAYPEAKQVFDYERLRLKSFEPGALLRTQRGTVSMVDPWRRPTRLLNTTFNGVGTLVDRWRMGKLRRDVTRRTLAELEAQPETSTREYLRNDCGFSDDLIERFFKPWFSGVFLESQLETSSRFFKFVFRMLASGDAALPASGMKALPAQLFETIPSQSLRLLTTVRSFDEHGVNLSTGERILARAIVVATDAPSAAAMMGSENHRPSGMTTCFQYAAPAPPFPGAWLLLNSTGSGPINHCCVPSNVAPTYAPAGQALVSVSTVGQSTKDLDALERDVRKQLIEWFGNDVQRWSLLAKTSIAHAVPLQLPNRPLADQTRLGKGIYRCGDAMRSPSIHAALESGRMAAEQLLTDFGLVAKSA